MGLRVKR
ncbi:unnamed protein product [Pieris macdunnoughi]|nr:unnamed protein product [Pieris macdunnoughi]